MGAGERYDVADAKAWAREHFHGVCNVVIPSYTADLGDINEQGIRHDVQRNIQLGFWGALLVSEAATSPEELRRFMEIAVDEAAGRQYFVLHGSFDSVDDLLARARDARAIGVDALLLSYPSSFYPRSTSDLLDHVRAVCDSCELGVILFAAPHFNLERLDPRGYPLEALLKIVELPNVVAVKYEVGQPGVVGSYEVFQRLADRDVLVTDPVEYNALIWQDLFGVQWQGTSNYEYLGGSVPRMFELMRTRRRDEALELYWRLQPARKMRVRVQDGFRGANFNHRYFWKYQAWLQGYNGGPLRQPVLKLTDEQMEQAARGLVASGLLDEAPTDFSAFFVGRNPA